MSERRGRERKSGVVGVTSRISGVKEVVVSMCHVSLL